MTKKHLLYLAIGLATITPATAENSDPARARLGQPDSAAQARILESYGKLPLSFEENRGQTDPHVRFISRGSGHTLFLTPNEAVLAFEKRDSRLKGQQSKVKSGKLENPAPLRMNLVGANPRARVGGLEELPGKANYFIGKDPAKWHTNVPTYAKVEYQGIYPGVDLVYYGNQRQLEYDFVVAPGADPTAIDLSFRGATRMHIDKASGDLVLSASSDQIRFLKPVVYQYQSQNEGTNNQGQTTTEKRFIEARYVTKGKQGGKEVGFQIAAYDTSKPLIIDPVLVNYSTYLGGSDSQEGRGIAVDATGNAYVTGDTNSTNFPTTPGAYQKTGGPIFSVAFVTKLNPLGTGLVYSTYLGGGSSASSSNGRGIAVDAAGNAYVTGDTSAPNFPTTTGAYQTTYAGSGDAFMTKLNPLGTGLLYSTYLGGSGYDHGNGIAVDAAGNAYVTGETFSTNFPTTAGAYQKTFGGGITDAFVTKLNPLGASLPLGAGLVYSTYLGGNIHDGGQAIAVDAAGNAYVTGYTVSANFPTTTGAYQKTLGGAVNGFVAKLNPLGAGLLYSTYLGGSGYDHGNGIAVDAAGNAYVTGDTVSTNFPTTTGAYQKTLGGAVDGFVTKLNPLGAGLLYSTYLGGNIDDGGQAIAVDAAGNAYVTGQTYSTNFPTTTGAYQKTGGGSSPDTFVTKLNPLGASLVYSTYLGGSSLYAPHGIAVDAAGNAYVTGSTDSTNFPTTTGAYQTTFSGSSDAFVTKLGGSAPANPALVSPSSGTGSAQALTFTYTASNGYQDISGSQIVINSTMSGAGACYVLFGRGSNAIALADDAGTPGPLTTLGAPTVLQNSQCSVLASISSQSFSGNTVMLTVYVVFKPAFTGAKNVYTAFSTNAGVSSGLQPVGTFTATVNTTPTSAVSVTPASGVGQAQAFTFNYFDPNGYPNTSGSQVLFSPTTSAVGQCYILFGRGTNQIGLADDTGSNFTLAPLGGQTVLQNSQCSVFAANSYQSGQGTNLFLTLFVAFKPPFAGNKNIYSGSTDNGGNRSAFVQLGTWTVPGTAPPLAVNSETPSAASGPSNPLTFVFSDPNGFADISGAQVIVNPTQSTGAGSCYIQFARSGLIALTADDGVSINTATLGQPTFLQNSQCIVNAAASYQAGSGNYLSLTLFVTMKTAGAKNVYASVSSNGGSTSGFSQVGSWNVSSPGSLAPVAVSPGTGAGPAGTSQYFTFTYSDPNGAGDISGSQIILNPALQGAFSCYVLYGRGTNLVAIANDTATTFTNGTLGTAGTIANSQCSIDLSKSFQVQTGNTVNLTLAVNFATTYRGLTYAFSNVVNNAGNASAFPALGTFLVQ